MKTLFTRTTSGVLINVLILFALNLGAAFPLPSLPADDETATPESSETIPPSDTPPPSDTDTPVPTVFEPTYTALPTFTETATLTGLDDQSLTGDFVPGEVLVRYKQSASKASVQQCLSTIPAAVSTNIQELNTLVFSVPAGMVAESIHQLEACPQVRFAEPNYIASIQDVIPSDPGWTSQYGLVNIRAPQGWQYATGSSAVTIAILDTGVETSHPDLAAKIVNGFDVYNNDNDPQDDNGHGTHVAGIAAAISNNGVGVAGVSWGARVMPVKVLNAAGNGSYADVAEGIIWATDHGAQVINLSLGGTSSSQLMQDAIDYAASRGVILVAASGNSGSNTVIYPARYPNVIAVAATDGSNARAWFSNFGPEVDLSAPGVSIYSTSTGGYSTRNGTSMATPFVAGLAAILRGIPGNASRTAIAQQMQSTALDLGSAGRDDYYGHGLIQMDAAILSVIQEPSETDTPAALLNGWIASPTFPPTLTFTPPPSPTEPATVTPTLSAPDSPPPSITEPSSETPEVVALNTPDPAGQSWLPPLCGLMLILLGILLFWLARREKDKTHHAPNRR